MIDTNSSHFRKNLLDRIKKLLMTIDDKIRDKKQQHSINREAVKISELSSSKVILSDMQIFDKYEFLTVEEILPSDQSRIIEQAKFTYSPLRKAFEKLIKTIENKGIQQVEALKVLK